MFIFDFSILTAAMIIILYEFPKMMNLFPSKSVPCGNCKGIWRSVKNICIGSLHRCIGVDSRNR